MISSDALFSFAWFKSSLWNCFLDTSMFSAGFRKRLSFTVLYFDFN